MHNWQKELQELKLTVDQKQKMKNHVVEQQRKLPKKAFNWAVVITPAFIALFGFCVLLFINDSSASLPMQQASQPTNDLFETDHKKYFQFHMRLSLAISLGILLNGFMCILIVMKTKRWHKPFIKKSQKILYKFRFVLIFMAPFLLYGFAVIAFDMLTTAQAKINVLYVLVLVLVCLSFLFAARNQHTQVCCPHCQQPYSAKEKRKLTAYFKIQLHCVKCGGKLFYSKRTRQVSGIASTVACACILLPSSFGVPFWLIVFGAIILSVMILVVLLPLFLELEGEEKPLF